MTSAACKLPQILTPLIPSNCFLARAVTRATVNLGLISSTAVTKAGGEGADADAQARAAVICPCCKPYRENRTQCIRPMKRNLHLRHTNFLCSVHEPFMHDLWICVARFPWALFQCSFRARYVQWAHCSSAAHLCEWTYAYRVWSHALSTALVCVWHCPSASSPIAHAQCMGVISFDCSIFLFSRLNHWGHFMTASGVLFPRTANVNLLMSDLFWINTLVQFSIGENISFCCTSWMGIFA